MTTNTEVLNIIKLLVLGLAEPDGLCVNSFGATYRLIRLFLSKKQADNFNSVTYTKSKRYYSRVDRESLLQIVFNEGKENKCQTSTSTATLSSTQKKVIRTA